MNNSIKISDDGYALSKVIPKTAIKRIIDWKALGVTKEYIDQQTKLKLFWNDNKLNFADNRIIPDIDDQTAMDSFFVTELSMPYNPEPDEKDMFVYYSDLGPLSGSAGYIRFREGYVWGTKEVFRS